MDDSFPRTLDVLDDVFAFIERGLGRIAGAEAVRPNLDLAVEEVFTNMVRHNPDGTGRIRIRVRRAQAGVLIEIEDPTSTEYDPFRRPEVDVRAPLEERRPGGLGVHLIKRLVDRYEYAFADGCSRITLYKQLHVDHV